MKMTFLNRLLAVIAVCVGLSFGLAARSGEPVAPAAPKAAATEAEKKEGEAKPDETPAPRARRVVKAPTNPRAIKLMMHDGSVIAGDLDIEEVQVTTEFGVLTVPISKIVSLTPGLDSNKGLSESITAKCKDLASDDYKTREQAHKDLVAMGSKVSMELDPLLDSENAEVKRHVSEILKEIETQAEDQGSDEEGGNKEEVWIRGDTLQTVDFTVVGKISPPQFGLKTKFGALTVNLGDVRRAERSFDVKELVRKSLGVPGQNLVQRQMKTTGLRVEAGDRIQISAEGHVILSPWGSNAMAGPDGAQNYGWYIANQIAAGALCARIGDKGDIFKVGSKSTFVAKASGTLYLGVAMMNEYSHEGYQFPGEFKVKLKVEPK